MIDLESFLHEAISKDWDGFQNMREQRMLDSLQSRNKEMPRFHIGMSGIGSPCLRKAWLDARLFHSNSGEKDKTEEAKKNLIFELGHIVESIIVSMMLFSGFEINQQVRCNHDKYPMLKGSADGIITRAPEPFKPYEGRLIEIKSANDASFKAFKEKGVYLTNPQYYNQVQEYMYSLMIEECVFIVFDKSNCRIYEEIIPFNQDRFNTLERAIPYIIDSSVLPPPISQKPTQPCTFCANYAFCFKRVKPEAHKNCKNCSHFNLSTKVCGKFNKTLAQDESSSCAHYQQIEVK